MYPARKNSEKWYKGEDVTISVLNKKGLPRNAYQNGLGKTFRWNVGTFDTLGTFRRVWRSLHIYIYRYLADKQLFSLAINTFIYWIFNVMFNPVHHHCHLFTDFYKRLTCAELKPFLTVRKSDTFIFWRASVGRSRWSRPTHL